MEAHRCWETPEPTRRAWPRGKRESGLSAIAEVVLAWLGAQGGESAANNDGIGSACLMAPRTVRKALAELETAGLVMRTSSGGTRRLTAVAVRADHARVA